MLQRLIFLILSLGPAEDKEFGHEEDGKKRWKVSTFPTPEIKVSQESDHPYFRLRTRSKTPIRLYQLQSDRTP